MTLAALVVALAAATAPAWGQNNPPVVSNVIASQRTDGSKLVDIYYDLADADAEACTITVKASSDAGASWTLSITALSGDIGPGIMPGTGKHIVWNSVVDLPGAFGSQYKVRVCADDGHIIPAGMVEVPAGEFQMGDPWAEGSTDERPVHTVYLSQYCIDTYDVTNQQYADGLNWALSQGGLINVISAVVYQADSGTSYPYCDTTTSSGYSRITWNGSTFGVVSGKESHPMVMVSWYGAAAYCNWRSGMQGAELCFNLATWTCDFTKNGFRFPTEAEWEKAAGWDPAAGQHLRFGEHTDGCGYSCLDGQRANYWSSGDPFESGAYPWTTPVGYYDGTTHGSYTTQNAQCYYGCYDMSGNVWEWCYDWYSDTYYSSSPSLNPTGPGSGSYRVLRGGDWVAYPNNCRSAIRGYITPGVRIYSYGFRCAVGTLSSRDIGCADSPVFTIDNRAGDLNCDGAIDFGDINPFVLALTNPWGYWEQYPLCDIMNADMDCNGAPGFSDINPFVACLASGDCDCP